MSADNTSEDIAQAFFDSGDHVEQFYNDRTTTLLESFQPDSTDVAEQELFQKFLERRTLHYNALKSILGQIREMRKRGYDRQFRAGTSHYILIISRSREHGLQPEQPFIYFEPKYDGGTNVSYCEEIRCPPQITLDRVALTPEVEQLLDRLLAHPID